MFKEVINSRWLADYQQELLELKDKETVQVLQLKSSPKVIITQEYYFHLLAAASIAFPSDEAPEPMPSLESMQQRVRGVTQRNQNILKQDQKPYVEAIVLNEISFDDLLKTLDNPPSPTQKLIDLMRGNYPSKACRAYHENLSLSEVVRYVTDRAPDDRKGFVSRDAWAGKTITMADLFVEVGTDVVCESITTEDTLARDWYILEVDVRLNFIRELEAQIEKLGDIHTEHCCLEHGCKYGDDDCCSVVSGSKVQSYPCIDCE